MDTNPTPSREPAARPLLFTPLPLRGVVAPNRIVLAPMVQYRAKEGVPTDFHLVHLGKFALGRFGIVMNEATAVEARGRVSYGCPGIWNDDQMRGWKRVVDYIHREGSLAAMQLAHAGRKASTHRAIDGTHPYTAADAAKGLTPWDIIGPTGEPIGPGQNIPAHMTQADIADVVRAFAEGARRSEAAGFDIVEIHGAHGYLIASFLSPISNTRNDEYGGDRAGRMKFALDITRAVRAAWPAHKPLFFRVSSLDGADGWNLDDTVAFAQALQALGVDVVDCSSGGLTGSAVAAPIKRYPGFQVPFAEAVRNAGVASMAVGLILDGKQAEQILQEGKADLIAIGRQALYDPFWPVHAAEQLGCDPDFAMWPEEYGWWLEKRNHSLVRR